jgi:predicted RNA-binding protein with EMAP domain
MTQIDCDQAMGNIWLLLTKLCKNLKTLKLEIPVKSNLMGITNCYLNPEYITTTEDFPETLEEMQLLGSFILQFRDFSFKLINSANDRVEINVNPNIARRNNKSPLIYFEFWYLVMEALEEIMQKMIQEGKASFIKSSFNF